MFKNSEIETIKLVIPLLLRTQNLNYIQWLKKVIFTVFPKRSQAQFQILPLSSLNGSQTPESEMNNDPDPQTSLYTADD